MISDAAFRAGYGSLAAAFGERLQSEATMSVYREVLTPLMTDDAWRRTVQAAICREHFPPTVAKLIEIADEQRGHDEPRPSLVAYAKLRAPSITDECYESAMSLAGLSLMSDRQWAATGRYDFEGERPSLEEAAQRVEQRRLTPGAGIKAAGAASCASDATGAPRLPS